MLRLTGAELIIRLLERHGIRHIAGIPGGANLPLYDALARSPSIRHLLARHEQGAAFIAQGIARVSRRAAVCFATSGPGATNLLTAIADAQLDSVPLVCITGQVPTSMLGTDAFQEVDTYGMSLPVTKHNFLLRSAEDLAEVIPTALHLAESGRPGPVVVDVPKDVQKATVTLEHFPAWPTFGDAASPAPETIARAAEMINEARKPILCLGGGVRSSQGGALACALAEKSEIPTACTLMGLGAMASDHPLNLGMLGMHATRTTNTLFEECDLLIALGMRFDDRATGKVAEFCPQAKILHIDIDASELDKIKQAHLGIPGDLVAVLRELIPEVEPQSRLSWVARKTTLQSAYGEPKKEHSPKSPQSLIHAVAEMAGEDAVVVTDVGQHQMWVAQSYPFTAENEWLTSGGLGTMGFGLPAAIGAALAKPEVKTVCFSGDGSFLMNLQELATAVETGLNIKTIILDNGSLGLVRQQQELFYQGRVFAADFATAPDFRQIAAGFGMAACDLQECGDPMKVLKETIESRGPSLIRVPVSIHEKVFPMVPPGAANRQMIGGENHACALS